MQNIVTQKDTLPGWTESILATDLPGLAAAGQEARGEDFARNMFGTDRRLDYAAVLSGIISGDNHGVAASDAMMDTIAGKLPALHSTAWQRAEDVSGMVPNVPAFLSGNPMNMVRRRRVLSEAAPLAIFADLSISGGVQADTMWARGAALLTVARVLSQVRPVELYAIGGTSCESGKKTILVAARIETAPLDIARAAHVLTEPGVYRGVFFSIYQKVARENCRDSVALVKWAWGAPSLHRANMAGALSRALSPGSEALYIGAMTASAADIAAWALETIRQHGGAALDADAA